MNNGLIKPLIYKKIHIPDNARHFIFSDVHGKKKEVDELIKMVGGTKNDYYTFIGDVIDRGSHNSAMLFHALYTPNTNMVLGNHEAFLCLSDADDYYTYNWTIPRNGGDQTFEQLFYVGMNFFSKTILENCPVILEVEHKGKNFGFIHAEIPYFYNNNKIKDWSKIIKKAEKDPDYLEELLTSRSSFDQVNLIKNNVEYKKAKLYKNNKPINIPKINGIDYVLFGHSGVFEPLEYENMIWFDTGYLKERICLMEFDFEKGKFIPHYLDEEIYNYINSNKNLDFS